MSNYLKIVPLFLVVLVVLAGCDFGKAPNMDQVRDTLMAEYGDEVFTEEELYGETPDDGEEVAKGGDGIFEFGNDCDADCQDAFDNYLLLVWGEDIAECDDACKIVEYEYFMIAKEVLEE